MNQRLAIDRYRAGAEAHGAATETGDHRRANACYRSLIRALAEMRRSPDRGLACLAPLLADEVPSVRCWAATHLLTLDEATAIETLEELATAQSPFVRFDAKMVLEEWRAGRLKIP